MNTGDYKATIKANDIRAAGSGTEFVYLLLDIDGEEMPAQIWLSPKSKRMAVAQLRACGFDPRETSLFVLKEDRKYLTGKTVDIEVYEEEYRGHTNIKARIKTANVTKKRIEEIGRSLISDDEPNNAGTEADDDIPF